MAGMMRVSFLSALAERVLSTFAERGLSAFSERVLCALAVGRGWLRHCCWFAVAFVLQAAAVAEGEPDLANADAKVGKTLYEKQCMTCHGPAGASVVPTQPILSGQHAEVLVSALREYRGKIRNNAVMIPMAANLSDIDIVNLAAYLSAQTPVVAGAADMELAKSAEKLYRGGVLADGIPACAACHGVTGGGLPPYYPLISGQYAQYTAAALRDYASGKRQNDIMNAIAAKLSEEQIDALAAYISGLAP